MNLTNQNIDKVIEDIRNFFQKAGVSRKDNLKICLVAEESLLRWQERFGEDKDFQLNMRKWFGAPKITIRLKAEPFNPLDNELEDDSIFSNDIMQNLLQYDTAGTIYRYENGCNELISFSTRERKPLKIPGGSITIAILLAIMCSFAASFMPQEILHILTGEVVAPILSALMSLIVTVTVFMMFFSIVSSICAIESTSTLSNIGFTVIGRFFFLSACIIALSIFISSLFFPVLSFSGDSSIKIGEIINLFLSIIPTNILGSFAEGKVLQVTVMAFLVGICITTIGNRIPNVKTVIVELNVLIFKVMETILRIIPFTVFLCLFKTLTTNDFSDVFLVWKIVVAELITYAAVVVVMLICLKFISKVHVADFVKKISPAVIIALSTASSMAAFPKNLEIAKNVLRVDEKFCTFFLPMALALFAPSLTIEIVVNSFYAAAVFDKTIPIVQLLIIAFLAIQLSIATPKVSGGALASFTILLTQLGFPLDLVGPLMIANVLADNILSALNVVSQDCELMTVAKKMKFFYST